MYEDSKSEMWWPALNCGFALAAHERKWGPPDPHYHYECVYIDDPTAPGVGSWVYMLLDMGEIQRVAVQYGWGTADLNTAVTTHDWFWEHEEATTATDFEPVEAKLDTFFTSLSNLVGKQLWVRGYRWTKLKDNGSGADGPSHRFATRALNPTSSTVANTTPQVACSVTEITAVRRRWGRFYLPWPAADRIDGVTGRYKSDWVDLIAAAAKTLYTPIEGDWRPVVYGEPDPHILDIESIRVDDVPDIIRTRRWRQSTYRKTLNI
jgi:hypothetical protein